MSIAVLYWFIAFLIFIIVVDSLLCKGKVKVHSSMERPMEGQRVWAHDKILDKWIYGYLDSLSLGNQCLISLPDKKPYTWDGIDYWVDLTEYK